jgi:phosphorylated CTD-interacting factor 1
MCARYDTISGAGYQAALPREAFEVLQRDFGVLHECYASPLNHCLDSFGSAFLDTDRFFGSKGSFLEQRFLEGGYQCNPPFLEEVMAPNAFHLLALLERAQTANKPLCFVCIWPGWDDCVAYDLLCTSRFLRKLMCFEKGDHAYTDGLQHRVTDMRAVYRRAGARSFAFFLQTDAAAAKWPTTDERLAAFKRAFMQPRV